MKVKVPYSIHSHLTRSSRKMQSWRVLLPSLHLSWGKIRRNIRTIHIFSIRILIERCFIFSITYKTDKTINICILPNSDKIWLFKINLWWLIYMILKWLLEKNKFLKAAYCVPDCLTSLVNINFIVFIFIQFLEKIHLR